MITNQDIKKLKTVFATKSDLKNFATKSDLKQFVTKEDAKNFATKTDLERFSRVIINNFITRDYLDERLSEMATKKDLDRVVVTTDAILKEVQDMRTESAAVHYRLENHGSRITKLESA